MKRVCPPIARTLMPVERDFVLTVDGDPIALTLSSTYDRALFQRVV